MLTILLMTTVVPDLLSSLHCRFYNDINFSLLFCLQLKVSTYNIIKHVIKNAADISPEIQDHH